MTKEEKNLLLKDLCWRLPYGVKIHNPNPIFPDPNQFIQTLTYIHGTIQSNWITFGTDCEEINVDWNIGNINQDVPKPYLRAISSMTKEEQEDYFNIYDEDIEILTKAMDVPDIIISDRGRTQGYIAYKELEWLYEHNFDFIRKVGDGYKTLIELGLAIEAPDNMYNN